MRKGQAIPGKSKQPKRHIQAKNMSHLVIRPLPETVKSWPEAEYALIHISPEREGHRVSLLTARQAHALSVGESGRPGRIPLLGCAKKAPEGILPARLGIRRNPERKPGDRAWQLHVAGEAGLFLSDEDVRLISRLTVPEFETGEPSWPRRRAEDIEDRIHLMEQDLEQMRKEAADLRANIPVMVDLSQVAGIEVFEAA